MHFNKNTGTPLFGFNLLKVKLQQSLRTSANRHLFQAKVDLARDMTSVHGTASLITKPKVPPGQSNKLDEG